MQNRKKKWKLSPSPWASGSNVPSDTRMVPVGKSQSLKHGSSGVQGVDPSDNLLLKQMQQNWAFQQDLPFVLMLLLTYDHSNRKQKEQKHATNLLKLANGDNTLKDLLELCATKGTCDDLKRLHEHGNAQTIITFHTLSLMSR